MVSESVRGLGYACRSRVREGCGVNWGFVFFFFFFLFFFNFIFSTVKLHGFDNGSLKLFLLENASWIFPFLLFLNRKVALVLKPCYFARKIDFLINHITQEVGYSMSGHKKGERNSINYSFERNYAILNHDAVAVLGMEILTNSPP